MRRVIGLLLALSLTAPAASKKTKAPSTASVTNTLIQMEREWSQARDSKTIDRILADDWVSVDFHGKTVTKVQAMAELKSAVLPAQSIELRQIKVRVFGNAAVVNGTDKTGRYTWMDVFVRREGRWQAVASQSTKIGE
jgi:hypothetical protein